jgi:hypothetical protein
MADVQLSSAPSDLAPASTEASAVLHTRRRRLVIGARTALVMILVAAVVVLCLGIAALWRSTPTETSGWLRQAFGMAFGHMAVWIAAILGIPSAVGMWAMAGAIEPQAVPALSPLARRAVTGIVVVALGAVATFVLVGGRGVTLFDLGFLGLCSLLSLGLAGAAVFAPRRGRALVSAAAMILVLAGVAWFAARVLGAPAA